MENIDKILENLTKSKFRSSFHLRKYMIEYINDKGLQAIEEHAYDFINKRIKPKDIKNDGHQTPMKGHPVFIAQHACGCCCRNCLEKWHHIDKNRELTEDEVRYLVKLIMKWIDIELNKNYIK